MHALRRKVADARYMCQVVCATLGCRLRSRGAQAHPEPIVVLGNQKSGTTAIAGLLARHTGLSVTLDMPAICLAIDGLLRGTRSLEAFARTYRWYFSNAIIKEPWLTFLATQTKEIVPGATFVLVVRDPRDNIRSICDRLGVRGDSDSDPPAIRRLTRGWREVFPDEAEVAERLHYVESLARRWRRAARVVEELAPTTVRVVRYEDFVADKAACIARLARDLGREPAEDVRGIVDKPFQPAGRSRDVAWSDFFGPSNLSRIERICADEMERYGYGGAEPPMGVADARSGDQ